MQINQYGQCDENLKNYVQNRCKLNKGSKSPEVARKRGYSMIRPIMRQNGIYEDIHKLAGNGHFQRLSDSKNQSKNHKDAIYKGVHDLVGTGHFQRLNQSGKQNNHTQNQR